MANITNELSKISAATYGGEVRSSIVSALRKVNDEGIAIHEEVDAFIQGELDTSLTSEVLPAQGKAVGDRINREESAVEQGLIYDKTYPLPLVWETGSIDASYNEVNESNPTMARTKGFYVPQKKHSFAYRPSQCNCCNLCMLFIERNGAKQNSL